MKNLKRLFVLSVANSAVMFFMICFVGSTGADDPPQQKEASAFPESDIFLFDLTLDGKIASATNGKNITARPGYENQPAFTPDNESFLFSQSDDDQTDIYEYFLASGETKRLTETENMEFSPIPSPDNQTISFVVDGEKANQSIWHITRENKVPVWTLKQLTEREPVGYYGWNHKTGDLIYWSRYGYNIKLAHQSKKRVHYVSGDAVPTTPQIIPGTENFSFVHRQGNGEVWIKELNPETLAIRPIATVVGNNTHYGWAPDGSILMMEGSTLNRWQNSDNGWQQVADLKTQSVASATRLAVSFDGKKLAVVGVSTKEPVQQK